jgi:hypothetical protein
MMDREISALIEEYQRLSKAIELERSKRFCQQYEIDKCEDRMAAIETRFQKAGIDISDYL